MSRSGIDSTTEWQFLLAAPDKVEDYRDYAYERRNRVVCDLRLLARSQMPPTSSAIGLVGEGEAVAIVALQAGLGMVGFEGPHSRHGLW
jgi:hypothetical protein